MFFTLGRKFPHIAGPLCKIQLEARQMRRFLHDVLDFAVYRDHDMQYLV